ncbi:MAG: VWA domain-containing protein, partial [Gammaproteobacteria bacterium]|nr:VWA domain-containing protein [Gammaproteobacteria bacterium]
SLAAARDQLLQNARNDSASANKIKASKKIISWKPSSQAANNAVIKLGRDEELKPEALDISVQIDGFRARVVIDGFYTNPHNRDLEGSFKFRLPDGAVPYFFAFGETAASVENNMQMPVFFDSSNKPLTRLSPQSLMSQRASQWLAPKEAIMVSREKAAFAYNDTVARKVDPALLEWAGAGIFSAKVFPLQAKKTHRVVLGYDLNLTRAGDDLMLDLPMTNEAIQKRINLFINKKGAEKITLHRIIDDELKAPVIISKNNELVQHTIEGSKFNGVRVTVERHANIALMGQDDAGSFFAKQWKVDLPATESVSLPRAVFAIDTSLSASPEKFHLWVDLIEKILATNEAEITEFALLSFNIDSHWWKTSFVKNTALQRTKLLRYLNQLILEGATDLASAINVAAAPKWWVEDDSSRQNSDKQFDLFLLSDGAITWGEKESFFISESLKKNIHNYHTVNQLYTYRLGQSGENAKLLTHLTREIGGGSYQLSNDTDLNQLAGAHKMVPWKIESVNLNGANDILISGRPDSVYPGQLITLTGRVSAQLGDEIVLTFSKGEQVKIARVPVTIKIDSSLTSRVFGQIAVNQLESIAALERKVASAFANHFRVPGASSSLLMLESKEDYERYHIKPSEDAFVA